MKITLVDKRRPLPRDAQETALRRLRLALARFDRIVSRLIVFVEETSPGDERQGTQVRLVAGTRLGPPVIVTDFGSEPLKVIAGATDRLARALSLAVKLHYGVAREPRVLPGTHSG